MFPAELLEFVAAAPPPVAPPRGDDLEQALEHLRWLTVPALAPYRVLDCRALSLSMKQTGEKHVDRFRALRAAPFQRTPIEDAITISCAIPPLELDEAWTFRAPEMEWKWDATFANGELVFSRSWSGLQRVVIGDGRIEVGRELCNGDARSALALVQYLISTYVLTKVAPHPLPPGSPTTTTRDAWLYSWSVHGRAAFFAAPMPIES
jgi:hypothetical protein